MKLITCNLEGKRAEGMVKVKVCIPAKWPIRSELIPVSVA